MPADIKSAALVIPLLFSMTRLVISCIFKIYTNFQLKGYTNIVSLCILNIIPQHNYKINDKYTIIYLVCIFFAIFRFNKILLSYYYL